MSRLLRGLFVTMLLGGATVGLLALSSSHAGAFQTCTQVYNCFQNKDCKDRPFCDTCAGAAFPVAGTCKSVAEG